MNPTNNTIEELQAQISTERELMDADLSAFDSARRQAQRHAASALNHSMAINCATQAPERKMAHITKDNAND